MHKSPELSIIKCFLVYECWEKYNLSIVSTDFPEELRLLYSTLDSFHKTRNTEKQNLHLLDLSNLFFANKPKDKEYYEGVFETLESYEPNLTTVITLIVSLKRARLLRELSIKSYEVAEGKADFSKLTPLLEGLKENPEQTTLEDPDEFVTTSLSKIVDQVYQTPGLRWRLSSLNRYAGSLRPGNFGFVFARPEVGKTTFLASEVSFMLSQTDTYIHWYNNEQVGEEVMLRIYQGYFGIETEQLLANIPKYEKLFEEETKGRLLLVDKANIHKDYVEHLCKKYPPALILFDQIDKIKGFDSDREDLRLGAIYIWARELAKTYCPVIGVCQSDGTGENVRYLTMANVANAKTSKQAEADWILGLGSIHDSGWESVRFLHLSKNKLLGDKDTDKKNRHAKWEVLIKPEIARYEDM